MALQKEEILKIMKYFSHRDCEIIEFLYGVGGKSPKSKTYVKKYFFVNDDYLNDLKERILRRLISVKYSDIKASFCKDDVNKSNKDLVYRMSEKFYNMFSNFNPVFIENKVNKLPKIYKEIIYLFYGLDGVNCFDCYDIANAYKITLDDFNELLKNGMSMLREMIINNQSIITTSNNYNELINLYGKENVKSSLLLLPDLTRNIIEEYFASNNKLSFKEVGKMYGVRTSHVHTYIQNGLNQIEEILSDKYEKNFLKAFYKKFEKNFMSNLKTTLYELENERKDIMFVFLGLHVKRKNISEIAKDFNVSEEHIKYIVRTNMLFIEQRMNELAKNYSKK